MTEKLPEGILLFDKPKGMSSFELVQYVRKSRNEKKAGHAGTLDPLASGLMIVGVGTGTKQLRHLVDLEKTYTAEICIGEKSATGDAEGPIIEKKAVAHVSHEALASALQELTGIQRLPVSAYSAMKQGGEALYKKARRGEKVLIPLRDMEVFEAKLLSSPQQRDDCVFVEVHFTVGSGTYIRSLAEALGEKLELPARLENLRRTQVGEFTVEHAQTL